jgi:heterodisulfide reductase subunit D
MTADPRKPCSCGSDCTCESEVRVQMQDELADVIRKSRAALCYECGKCSGICPVARYDSSFSPRSLLVRAVRGECDSLVADQSVWSCLTCGLCDTRCPVSIDYGLLTKAVRAIVRREGGEGTCTHGGAVQSLTRIMKAATLKQDRLGWIDSSLKTKKKGETVFFVGCTPYFDVLFADTGASTLEGTRGAVKLLNAVGITPAVLPNERCCGHDMLWSGDVDGFRTLAAENLRMLAEAGAARVVFACPEGYALFKSEYPAHFGELPFEVVHITEVLAEALEEGKLSFADGPPLTVTFQDPCRLGRHMGVYDAPRALLNAMPGVTLEEMRRSRERAICCGVGGWTNCTSFTKQLQVARLREAACAGASVLVTACPKCEIHFNCTMNDSALKDEVGLEITDLLALAASRLA